MKCNIKDCQANMNDECMFKDSKRVCTEDIKVRK